MSPTQAMTTIFSGAEWIKHRLVGVPPHDRHTTVWRAPDGVVHVQSFGEPHVVAGSERIIDLAPGETAVIRHISA